jgi:hypothetical protein
VAEEMELLQSFYSEFAGFASISPRLILGDSTQLTSSLVAERVGLILTSPPYGTRIDYAMAMAIELACLEPFASFDFEALRRQLIGTTLTSHTGVEVISSWGREALDFLGRVRSHRSKASDTYYTRYYENYFSSLFGSFKSLSRLAAPGVRAALVVQGSYYKEIYLDLARVTVQMLKSLGWELDAQVDREVTVSFTLLNPASKRYPKAHRPFESVVVLRKL